MNSRHRNVRIAAAAALAALSLAGGVAHAGHWERGQPRDARDWRDDRRGGGVDYARVTAVQPLVERVRYSEPVQRCWEEARLPQRADRTGATLLGGVLGAVVGSQFGHGDGRRVATVAGAVVGGALGREAATRSDRHDYDYDYDGPSHVQRCAVREELRFEERVRGYRVSYRYHGRDYVTELPYDPGPRLRVAVDARPL